MTKELNIHLQNKLWLLIRENYIVPYYELNTNWEDYDVLLDCSEYSYIDFEIDNDEFDWMEVFNNI